MNAQQIATTKRSNNILLAAQNAGLTPYMLGAVDAGCGRECTPCEYYIWAGDVAEYRQGYNDQAQDMHAEQHFGLMLGAMVGSDELAQMIDTLDYEQDVLDREWHSRGGW